jgi:hypothetical protein
MGFSSQAGQMILRTQAVQGTYQADTGTSGVALKIRGGTLAPTRSLMVADAEIGGTRDVVDAYLGPVAWAGDISFYCRLKAVPTLLKACLGTSATVTTTGVTTHTITPLDAATLPFLSIEEVVGGSLEVFHYTDVVVNTLHLECASDGYVMGTVGLVAMKQTAGNTKTSAPVWDNSPMIPGTNVTITYNAVALPAKSFSIDINNNFEVNDFRLGSFYLGALTGKRREITMATTIRPVDSSYWRQAVYGLPASTAPGGLLTKQQAVISITSYENIASSTPPTPYSLGITIPQAAIEPFSLSPNADDVIENAMTIQALRPNPATPILTAVAVTDQVTIA